MKNGLSGISAFCWRTHLIALFVMILGEVVALFRGLLRFDRCRALIDRRITLVGLAADEPIEILEPAAAGGPCDRTAPSGLVCHTGTS